MDKKPIFGNKFSVATAFVILDAVAALPLLLLVAIAGFYLSARDLQMIEISLTVSALVLPCILMIVGAWRGLKFEEVDNRRALFWAVMPWPMSILWLFFIVLVLGE